MTGVRLRPAKGTEGEGLLFARYLDTAADGMFKLLLGNTYDRIISQAYLIPGHDLSFETAVFAQIDGQVVGMASAYSSVAHAASSDRPLEDAAGLRAIRMGFLSMFARGMLTFMSNVPDGDYYLQAVAVDNEMRGSGIGSFLLDDVEQRAVSADCRTVALDVDIKNEGARRLYERRGFGVAAQSPSIWLTPGTGVYRMTKTLPQASR